MEKVLPAELLLYPTAVKDKEEKLVTLYLDHVGKIAVSFLKAAPLLLTVACV